MHLAALRSPATDRPCSRSRAHPSRSRLVARRVERRVVRLRDEHAPTRLAAGRRRPRCLPRARRVRRHRSRLDPRRRNVGGERLRRRAEVELDARGREAVAARRRARPRATPPRRARAMRHATPPAPSRARTCGRNRRTELCAECRVDDAVRRLGRVEGRTNSAVQRAAQANDTSGRRFAWTSSESTRKRLHARSTPSRWSPGARAPGAVPRPRRRRRPPTCRGPGRRCARSRAARGDDRRSVDGRRRRSLGRRRGSRGCVGRHQRRCRCDDGPAVRSRGGAQALETVIDLPRVSRAGGEGREHACQRSRSGEHHPRQTPNTGRGGVSCRDRAPQRCRIGSHGSHCRDRE